MELYCYAVQEAAQTWNIIKRLENYEMVIGEMFFREIFEVSPVVLELYSFEGSSKCIDDALYKSPKFQKHARGMVRMLGKVVEMMSADSSNSSHLAGLLQELGGRHVAYGVGPLHFSVLETAIIRALTKALGGSIEWTEDARKGWAAVLKFIGKAMMAGCGSKKSVGLKIVKDEHDDLNNDPRPERCAQQGTLRLQVVAPTHRHKNGFDAYPKVGETTHYHTTDCSGQFHESFRRSKSGSKYNKRRSRNPKRCSQRVKQQWDNVIFESCELTSDDDSDQDHIKNEQDDVSMAPSACDSSISALSISAAAQLSFPNASINNAIIDPIERLPDRIEASRICPNKSGRDCAPRKPWRRHSLKFASAV